MSAPVWQLGLSLTLSGAGMLSTLYLSNWMASRPKMPFVVLPGVASALATGLMAFTNNSLLFLFLGGVGLMFSTITRPAVAAIVRLNYPASHRGQATGEIRAWSSLVFVLAFLASSAVLDVASNYSARLGLTVVRGLILLAGAMCLTSFLFFHRIRVAEDPSDLVADYRPHVLQSFREAFAVVAPLVTTIRQPKGCSTWASAMSGKPGAVVVLTTVNSGNSKSTRTWSSLLS